MDRTDQILMSLLKHCKEYDIFPDKVSISANDDLFEYGVIDSMGINILLSIIEDNYNIDVPEELLISELRTPRKIADFIANHCDSAVANT